MRYDTRLSVRFYAILYVRDSYTNIFAHGSHRSHGFFTQAFFEHE